MDRQALAGSLILYPAARGRASGAGGEIDAPWTLNFFSADLLTTDQVRLAHRLLEERLTCLSWTGPSERLVYLPATADRETDAAADDASFARAGELPEIFSILADTNYQVVRSRFSTLSPDTPILSAEETKSLYEAGASAEQHFTRLYGRSVVLDIEFKLTPNHQIVFKQARPYTPR